MGVRIQSHNTKSRTGRLSFGGYLLGALGGDLGTRRESHLSPRVRRNDRNGLVSPTVEHIGILLLCLLCHTDGLPSFLIELYHALVTPTNMRPELGLEGAESFFPLNHREHFGERSGTFVDGWGRLGWVAHQVNGERVGKTLFHTIEVLKRVVYERDAALCARAMRG